MPERCPHDIGHKVELYCLKKLRTAEAQAFEQHLIWCPRCSEAVERMQSHVLAAKAACGELGRAFLMPIGA